MKPKEQITLIHEIVITIRINGAYAGSVSATPRNLQELAAGWLLTEGKIGSIAQIAGTEISDDMASIDMTITEGSTGSRQRRSAGAWTPADLQQIFALFAQDPPLFASTRAAHSCMIVRRRLAAEADGGIEVLYRSEDAGRHSALDKAIGWALLHGADLQDCLLMTSGRISTRMAVKAGRAGAGALAGKGTVTAEAVEIARENHMDLIGYVKADSAVWFCRGGDSGEDA